MTTAVIGTGGLGSVIARELASGGETLRLSSADHESARVLAAKIGRAAVVAVDNRDALRGADAVVLALRFGVLKGVIDEIADPLTDKLLVVPSNPVGLDAQGNVSRLLPKGQTSGEVVAGWLPAGTRLAMAFGSLPGDLLESARQPVTGARGPLLRDRRRPCWRGSRAVDPNGRLRAGEGRRDRTVGSTRGGRRPSRSGRRPRRGAVIDRRGLTASPDRPGGRPSCWGPRRRPTPCGQSRPGNPPDNRWPRAAPRRSVGGDRSEPRRMTLSMVMVRRVRAAAAGAEPSRCPLPA